MSLFSFHYRSLSFLFPFLSSPSLSFPFFGHVVDLAGASWSLWPEPGLLFFPCTLRCHKPRASVRTKNTTDYKQTWREPLTAAAFPADEIGGEAVKTPHRACNVQYALTKNATSAFALANVHAHGTIRAEDVYELIVQTRESNAAPENPMEGGRSFVLCSSPVAALRDEWEKWGKQCMCLYSIPFIQ